VGAPFQEWLDVCVPRASAPCVDFSRHVDPRAEVARAEDPFVASGDGRHVDRIAGYGDLSGGRDRAAVPAAASSPRGATRDAWPRSTEAAERGTYSSKR
jgi:hypothetical protein